MPPRALFVAATIDARLGGIARSVPALAASLAGPGTRDQRRGTGVTVTLIAPRAREDTLGSIEWMEAVDVRLCDGFGGVKQELERLTRDTDSPPAFIYHAGVWNSLNHFVARLGRRKGIPVIVSTRSMLDPWALNHRKWKKRLAWWLYARRDLLSATAIHATAELEAGYVRKALGKACPPVMVVPNGVALAKSKSLSESKSGLGQTHGDDKGLPRPDSDPDSDLGSNPRRILFLSRIHPKKGIGDLIKAFGSLNPEGWELVIAGNDDGGHQAACERLAKEQPNAGRIRFHGAVADADKWELYRSADLFVLPSYSENFGIVVGEALGCGVPVVTTTATPWGEFSLAKPHASRCFAGHAQRDEGTKGELGLWVVEPGVETVKASMREAMALSDAERKAMGARGAEWIRREFSWEAIGRQFLEEAGRVLPEND